MKLQNAPVNDTAVAIKCSMFNSQRAIFRMVALRAGFQ
jgi:hypothetical protein